jgi:hypothetical protein
MLKRYYLLSFAFLVILLIYSLLSCKCHPVSASDITKAKDDVAMKQAHDEVLIQPGYRPDSIMNYRLKKAWIENNKLFLDVSWSGGCKEHSWELIFNGMIAKSLPPQATLYLKHNANGDMCKKLMLDTLCFSLKPMEQFGKTIRIRINQTDELISLNFK